MNLDLSGLVIFRHLARSGSFSETARAWAISQPKVSLAIARIEAQTGLCLFNRTLHGAQLTPAGAELLERADEVCTAYFAFLDAMHSLARRHDRRVAIGTDRSVFSARLKHQFSQQPRADIPCEFSPVSQNWARDLEQGRCDVVLAARFLRTKLSPRLQEAVVHHERGVTVAWNPDFHHFNENSFSFPDILHSSLLVPGESVIAGFTTHLEHWCEHAYGLRPPSMVLFASEQEAMEAAAAGLGVLLSPGDALARVDLAGHRLTSTKTFEFLLPEALTFGIYCRSEESSREVLTAAAALVRSARFMKV